MMFPILLAAVAARIQMSPKTTEKILRNFTDCPSVIWGQIMSLTISSRITAVTELIEEDTVEREAENMPATKIPGIPGIEPIVSMTKSGKS
jgi:hypothetical protein